MVKIYPTMVFEKTALHNLYKQGKYNPITTERAAELIADFFSFVPGYCRVMRVQRDIPTKLAKEGVGRNNLRQYVDDIMKQKGIKSRDIRAREIGHVLRDREKKDIDPGINVLEYDAADGKEFFISIEDKNNDAIIGFCRLRFPSQNLRNEITERSALIRELHIYGTAVGIGKHDDNHQHKGFGKQLMEKAEEIAKMNGKEKIVVISGVGVRGYYRRLGYGLEGPYMVKKLS